MDWTICIGNRQERQSNMFNWKKKERMQNVTILLTISDRYESDMDLNNGNLTK